MVAVKRRCLPIGKCILIHRKRSPFPYLGKVNCIPNFVKNRLKHGKSIVFGDFYQIMLVLIKQWIQSPTFPK